MLRKRNIKRNQRRLRKLGLLTDDNTSALSSAATTKPKKSTSAPKASIPRREMPNRKGTNRAPTAEDDTETTEKTAPVPTRSSSRVTALTKKAEEKVATSGDEAEWDLTKIYTIKELNKKKPTMCGRANDGEVNCGLVACSRWESKGQKPWNTCLDCQVK